MYGRERQCTIADPNRYCTRHHCLYNQCHACPNSYRPSELGACGPFACATFLGHTNKQLQQLACIHSGSRLMVIRWSLNAKDLCRIFFCCKTNHDAAASQPKEERAALEWPQSWGEYPSGGVGASPSVSIAKQSKAMQCKAKQCKAMWCKAKQCKAIRSKAMQSNAKQCKAMRSNANQSNTKQCNAKAMQSKAKQCEAIPLARNPLNEYRSGP